MQDYIVLLGRAGLEYHDKKGIKYFVDSELCMGDEYDEYDYAIYVDSIKRMDSDRNLNNNEKIKIAEKVLFLCKKDGMKPQLFYDK
ncbi:hypothetical protein GCWU000282_02055 [Catonella morbi ATCC 51271]|uniref:Uncharacterized protein n=1 Tax=Catonella morbi ATCC 51271 TaxID=592026 RepID=V2Y672_9FIRM|nr:hypothetical protein [Catonella morbi]ESL03181.1 hypothetical protein GCWU000282_02055 [Catonella morbi ATCC 51271]